MATTKLGLPTITGNMTADVVRDHNALAQAIDDKAGAAGGLATLGSDGKVPSTQLNVDTSNLATKTEVSTLNQTVTSHLADDATGAHKASNISFVPPAGMTATDVQQAIAQAFQSANDGKTAVANAVTAKGVTASPSDTFPTLASKIGQINTGKRYASGTVTVSSTTQNFQYAGSTTIKSFRTVTVTGLPFKPKRILIYAEEFGFHYKTDYSEGTDSSYPKTIKISLHNTGEYVNTGYNLKGDILGAQITDTSFVMPTNASSAAVCKWEIYGE